MPLTLGQQLDGNRYTLLAKLGQGGAGSVYKVQDNRAVPGMPVTLAVKEISVSGLADPLDREENAAAFRSEVRLLMSLNHPYLTQVVNFFAEGDNYYLVMDFVDGKTLLKALDDADGPLPVSSVLDWFWQLCDVLVYLHGLDPPIIFRDLKPGNVMVTRQAGIVKLIDFGIARFFKQDSAADTRALGTPGYAPPEQYGRSQTDERSDIYSLGVTIYELLTNINPDEHIFNLPPALTLNPAIPPPLAVMLARMTLLEPAARYQTILAVRSDLAKLYPKPAHPTPPQTLRVLAGQQPAQTPPLKGEAGKGSSKAQSAPLSAQTPPLKGEAGRGTASPDPDPPPAPPVGRGATKPQPTRAIAGLDERYLATPPPLPAERKVSAATAQPAPPVTSDQQHPPRTLPANNSKLKTQNSKLKTIILALLLLGLVVGSSYFGLLPFSLPFIGTASHSTPPDKLYPNTVAAPPGVTNPALNSRSPRGQWWMPGYDWGRTGFSHDNGPIVSGNEVWSYPITNPNNAPSNLIVANEGYYMISPGQTAQGAGSSAIALDASGQPAWSFDLPAASLAMNHLAYAKSDKATFLYLQDSSGQLYATNPAVQGHLVWQRNLGSPSPYAPVVANGVLYATTPLTLTALDATTGQQMWQSGGLFRSPLLLNPDASSLYIVSGQKLTALNPANGKVRWQSDDLVAEATRSVIYQILATADTIYLGTESGTVITFDSASGSQLAQFSIGALSGFAAEGNTLFVAVPASSKAITARDSASGFERWTYPLSGGPVGSPIIVGDNLYVLSADSKLTILNTRSGALVKSITLPDTPLGEAAYANATLYYFGEKGLHAIR